MVWVDALCLGTWTLRESATHSTHCVDLLVRDILNPMMEDTPTRLCAGWPVWIS